MVSHRMAFAVLTHPLAADGAALASLIGAISLRLGQFQHPLPHLFYLRNH